MATGKERLKAYIDPNRCDRSPFCPALRSCPAHAIVMKGGSGLFGFGGLPTVDADKCTGCARCTQFCPHNAIRMKGPR